MTNLILVSAFPGCGKTYTSKALSEAFHIPIISTGKIRYGAGMKQPYSDNDLKQGYEIFERRIMENLIKGRSIAAEATFNRVENRTLCYNYLDELDGVCITIVRCNCSINEAKRRIKKRNQKSEVYEVRDVFVLERYIREYEPIEKDEAVIRNIVGFIQYNTEEHIIELVNKGRNHKLVEDMVEVLEKIS